MATKSGLFIASGMFFATVGAGLVGTSAAQAAIYCNGAGLPVGCVARPTAAVPVARAAATPGYGAAGVPVARAAAETPGVGAAGAPAARRAATTPGAGAAGPGLRAGTPMNRGGPVNRAGRR